MEKVIIILTGAPGSGKGYLGECLIKTLQESGKISANEMVIISTGDLIRREIKSESALGYKIKSIMEAGEFVSDEIIASLLKENLLNNPARITILDGYPRTEGQVSDLARIIGNRPVYIIHRDTPNDLILKRIQNRRICEKCGKVQTADHADCVSCHGKLVMRKDDAAIEKRLELYAKETVPALELLRMAYPYRCCVVNGQEDAEVSVRYLISEPLAELFEK